MVTVKFEQFFYDVLENVSQVEICVVLTGQTERTATIFIETSDVTAKGTILLYVIIQLFYKLHFLIYNQTIQTTRIFPHHSYIIHHWRQTRLYV